MKFFKRWVLSLASVIALAAPSQAGFIFDIGDVTTVAGTTVIVPVTVTTPDGTQFGANGGFNLGIDVVPAGVGLPAGLTYNVVPVTGSVYFSNPSMNNAFNAVFNLDGIVNSNAANGAAPALANNVPATVFNLQFDVAGGVPGGTVFNINFASNALTSATNSSGTALTLNAAGPGTGNEYALRSGSITINSVPEPSSIALVGLVLGGGAFVIARRRKK